jgi:hypothetical protein
MRFASESDEQKRRGKKREREKVRPEVRGSFANQWPVVSGQARRQKEKRISGCQRNREVQAVFMYGIEKAS